MEPIEQEAINQEAEAASAEGEAQAAPTGPVPTIGRMVHYFVEVGEHIEPRAAIIAYVHGGGVVNLGVFDGNGNSSSHTSVQPVEGENVVGRWNWPARA